MQQGDVMFYRIEFFELAATATPDVPNAFRALTDLAHAPVPAIEIGAYMRELWELKLDTRVVRGQFRKFRMTDLPEIGRLGGEAEQMHLAENQGLIEKNYFALYKRHSLLAWHTNGHGNTPTQFAKMLSKALGTSVEANPLIQANGLKRLMRGDVVVRSLELSIPRPRDTEYYPDEVFSQHLFDAMGEADGDRIRVSITTDGRVSARPQLGTRVKRALKELVSDQAASTARIQAIEDGIEHPIDLIADRITSTQEIEHEGRYPSPNAIYGAIDNALDEEQAAIDAVLGRGII